MLGGKDLSQAVDACVARIQQTATGRKLIERVTALWTEYKGYEPTAILKVDEGPPRFDGNGDRSRVPTPSAGAGAVAGFININADKIMCTCPHTDQTLRIQYYKKSKKLSDSVTIDEDGTATFEVFNLWDDLEWNVEAITPNATALELLQSYCKQKDLDFEPCEPVASRVRDPTLTLSCPVENPESTSYKAKDVAEGDKKDDKQPVENKDQCVSRISDGNVTTTLHPTKLFIVVAHELIHMKHFLEERVFICRAVADLIDLAKFDNEPKGKILEKLGGETLPGDADLRVLLIDAAKDEAGLQWLCRLAHMHGSNKAFDRFPLVTTAGLAKTQDLRFLAYRCKDSTDASVLKLFPEYVWSDGLAKFKEHITNFEERRTLIGPDRDAITENQIRFECGEPLRFLQQRGTTTIPIDVFNSLFQLRVLPSTYQTFCPRA